MANTVPVVSFATTDIDPSGDVVLVVERIRLRVSSKVLTLASPVWKAMFSSNFVEGTVLSKGSPCIVPLPEDNVDAISMLCNILHYRHQYIAKKPSAASLEQLAVVTDKYDCVDAMSFYSGFHLIRLCDSAKNEYDSGRLLYPATAFNYAPVFQRVTKALVYDTSRSRLTDIFGLSLYGVNPSIKRLLPDGLLEAIKDEQTNIKYTLLNGLERLIDPFLEMLPPVTGAPQLQTIHTPMYDPTFISECKCVRVAMFLKRLSLRGVWPISHAMMMMSLSEILSNLEWFAMVPRPATMDHIENICTTCNTDFDEAVSVLRAAAENAFEGFCLECVKYGREGCFQCRKYDEEHSPDAEEVDASDVLADTE
ncbi:hypothetical protein MMC13_002416 [Lambiella insularis]|nr:hypothetical protein [Lambiella insularis]